MKTKTKIIIGVGLVGLFSIAYIGYKKGKQAQKKLLDYTPFGWLRNKLRPKNKKS